jgi:hypothetical protein
VSAPRCSLWAVVAARVWSADLRKDIRIVAGEVDMRREFEGRERDFGILFNIVPVVVVLLITLRFAIAQRRNSVEVSMTTAASDEDMRVDRGVEGVDRDVLWLVLVEGYSDRGFGRVR